MATLLLAIRLQSKSIVRYQKVLKKYFSISMNFFYFRTTSSIFFKYQSKHIIWWAWQRGFSSYPLHTRTLIFFITQKTYYFPWDWRKAFKKLVLIIHFSIRSFSLIYFIFTDLRINKKKCSISYVYNNHKILFEIRSSFYIYFGYFCFFFVL